MKKKRIVVTGMGVVSCFGNDVDHFYDSLLEGKSGVKAISHFSCEEFPTKFAAGIENFDCEGLIDRKQERRIDPFIRYGLVAGKKAVLSAGFGEEALAKLNKTRAGIIIGSGMGGMHTFSEGVYALMNKGPKRLTPFFVPYIITNMGGALLAIELGFMGPNYSISTACATANYSIVSAANHIRMGQTDLMVCGGIEAAVSPIGLAGFVANKALSERNHEPTKASRPWDKGRDGFVMGEGAGILVLESLEHALARGAPILAEYLGGAMTCDAFHITAPRDDGRGVSDCMEAAIRDAEISKERINYINAHATSTPVGDMAEVEAIHQVFGDQAGKIKINGTKSMIGHCLGAAGGVEAIATIQAIRRGRLHPTINLDHPEPGLKSLDPVAHKAIDFNVDAGLSNSFGFGGHNSSLIFGRFHG